MDFVFEEELFELLDLFLLSLLCEFELLLLLDLDFEFEFESFDLWEFESIKIDDELLFLEFDFEFDLD